MAWVAGKWSASGRRQRVVGYSGRMNVEPARTGNLAVSAVTSGGAVMKGSREISDTGGCHLFPNEGRNDTTGRADKSTGQDAWHRQIDESTRGK